MITALGILLCVSVACNLVLGWLAIATARGVIRVLSEPL